MGEDCMTAYQQAISQIKNDLLDLWLHQSDNQSYTEWYKVLGIKFQQRFDIKEMAFYLYNETDEKFIAIQEDFKGGQSITYEQLQTEQDGMDDALIFENEQGVLLGILRFRSTKVWREFSETPYLTEFHEVISRYVQQIVSFNDSAAEAERFKLLFSFTELFNSTMKSEKIIDNVLLMMERVFPAFPATLILSKEQIGMERPYQVFNQLTERASTVETFLEGHVTMETCDGGTQLMNAPLKGRQGVYGVLRVQIDGQEKLSKMQKGLIRTLASSAGSALEKSSLYNQSYRLIDDLQLINEASRKLNSGLPFNEMIAYLKQQLSRALLPDEIVFAFYNEHLQYELKEMSSDFFKGFEGELYLEFMSNYLLEGKESLFDANFGHEFDCSTTYKSVIGLPIMDEEVLIGFALCLHRDKYSFTFDDLKLMRSLIMHASLAIANLQLRDRLQVLAERDHLTGLYARRYMDRYIDQVIKAKAGGLFLIVDVDDFKQINDKYGHDIGDKVLKQIGACMTGALKQRGIAARWGGEEFAIYLPNTNSEVHKLPQSLLASIPIMTEPSVTITIGGVYWESDAVYDFKELFKAADHALYEAKKEGKNRFYKKSLIQAEK